MTFKTKYWQHFLYDQDSPFSYNQSYLMVLYIIETKLFKEPKETKEKSFPKYRCNRTFKSKAFDFINLPKILKWEEVCNNLQSNFEIFDIPMVVNSLNPSTI